MNTVADLFAVVTADQAGARQIARITISPDFWQEMMGAVVEIWHTTSSFDESERIDRPDNRALLNLMGVPMELDELQVEEWRLWNAVGAGDE